MALKTPQTAFSPAVSIAPGDTTTLKTLRTGAAASGEIIGRLRATSSNTDLTVLQFVKNIGGTDYVIGEVQVADGAGTDSNKPWKDILADINSGLPITLGVGDILKVKTKTTLAAGKIDITAEGAAL